MGNEVSTPTANNNNDDIPVLLSSLSPDDVAKEFQSLGAKYEQYMEAIIDNGVNGEVLYDLISENDNEMIQDTFDELEIKSKLHRKVLLRSLLKAKEREQQQRQQQQQQQDNGNKETTSIQHHQRQQRRRNDDDDLLQVPTVTATEVVSATAIPSQGYLQYFEAAEDYKLNVNSPSEDVIQFDKITDTILKTNPNASFAAINLILTEEQHPISAKLRRNNDNNSIISNRNLAYMKNHDSVCYYLVHDPTRDDVLIRQLDEGNVYGGTTYVGHVLKNKNGMRVGAICQVIKNPIPLDDENNDNEQNNNYKDQQITLLKRLAKTTEDELEKRLTLLHRKETIQRTLLSNGYSNNSSSSHPPGDDDDDEIILQGHGTIVQPVTASQVRAAPPSLFPSPAEVQRSGRPRDSSQLQAYQIGVATTEAELMHLPRNFFDKVDAAGMPRPPIGCRDMERTAVVEALALHNMDPDGPTAGTLRDLVATAAELFNMPLAQISFHNHAKEFAFCPFNSGLTTDQSQMLKDFVEDILITDSKGSPFLGSRGRGNAVCNYAILTKKTFVVHDLWEDAAFTMYRDLQFIRSYVGCPILSADGQYCIALLCMFDFKARPDFSKAHELQAETIARTIGQVIENWSLRQEILEMEKERRLLNRRVDNDKRAPPEGDVTFVFTDIQSSTLLWETDATLMENALKIHDNIMRKCCADSYGYEITTEGDAFLLAFHDPIDAISFALQAQRELQWAPWPDSLLEIPEADDSSENCIRGFRVRMGIHRGQVTAREHEITGRVRYLGKATRITKSVEAMCHGGQILLTMDAWRAAYSMMEDLGSPQVVDLGEHVLMTGTSSADGVVAKRLLQLIPKDFAYDYFGARRYRESEEVGQEIRGRRFPPPITVKKLSPSFYDAPYYGSHVTIAFVYFLGLERLDDEVSEATLGIIGKLLRSQLTKTHGYECKEDRGLWMIVFHTPSSAVQFGLMVLDALSNTSALDDSIDRHGLVKIGVHSGTYKSMGPHPTTGRAEYFGPVVNRAARVAAAADPGQVYLGITTVEKNAEDEVPPPSLDDHTLSTELVGVKSLKGVKEPMALFSCGRSTPVQNATPAGTALVSAVPAHF